MGGDHAGTIHQVDVLVGTALLLAELRSGTWTWVVAFVVLFLCAALGAQAKPSRTPGHAQRKQRKAEKEARAAGRAPPAETREYGGYD